MKIVARNLNDQNEELLERMHVLRYLLTLQLCKYHIILNPLIYINILYSLNHMLLLLLIFLVVLIMMILLLIHLRFHIICYDSQWFWKLLKFFF